MGAEAGLNKVHFLCGAFFGASNWGIQFFVGDPTRKRAAVWAGVFMHFLAAALLGFSTVLLVNAILDRSLRSIKWTSEKWDMAIAYVLFAFAGICLSCLGVFLRGGSWGWHASTLASGLLLGLLADVGVRQVFVRRLRPRPPDRADTWEVPDEHAAPGLRRR
eukprot:TRINITY_DN61483_c0_g1_i1.p2 TRINITY_DN61483_c0_g1~~TRINITY_DN61483_c0_g1_i1.p2  ORF type:complete len:188 (+),score=66.33 TRINITY_DN61483_c0_g1_i1:79-564(+)